MKMAFGRQRASFWMQSMMCWMLTRTAFEGEPGELPENILRDSFFRLELRRVIVGHRFRWGRRILVDSVLD